MPPVVAAAAIAGVAAVGGAVISAKSQSSATKRSLAAQEKAANKAEAYEREQDEFNRAERARADAEEARRFAIQQANEVRKQQQEDALLADQLERANYEDAIRYNKAVKLAQLTGQAAPPPPPRRTTADQLNQPVPTQTTQAATSGPVMARDSRANALVQGASLGQLAGVPGMSRDPRASMQMPTEAPPLLLGNLAQRRRQRLGA